jgi:hypothetical protein
MGSLGRYGNNEVAQTCFSRSAAFLMMKERGELFSVEIAGELQAGMTSSFTR